MMEKHIPATDIDKAIARDLFERIGLIGTDLRIVGDNDQHRARGQISGTWRDDGVFETMLIIDPAQLSFGSLLSDAVTAKYEIWIEADNSPYTIYWRIEANAYTRNATLDNALPYLPVLNAPQA